MKFQSAFVLFTAAVSAIAPPPTCKGSTPSYCKYTSNRDATECRRLFAKNYINVATCQLPAKTVTSTRVKRATIITTKTIAPPARTTKLYKTITRTGRPTTLPTITVTATSTEIDTTVVTDSTAITEVKTVTDTELNSMTNTQTVTSTSTSFLPFSDPQSCTRKKRARGVSIPTSCSCFLTATKPAVTRTTVITKNKPAITHTVYKISGPRKVISRTIVIVRYASGPTISAPETTKTSTATITQTDHTITTITNSQTTTTTEVKDVTDTVTQTKTETATATKSPCDNIGSEEAINQQISGSVIEITASKDASGPNAAKVGNGQCDVFSTKPSFSSSCSSPLCPRGFPNLDIGSDDGFDYYLGPCFGTAVA
ncbi:uncharacterized protein FIESC28_02847 [Fusarium coffeatum]|uniref:Uncharacterized protein n=1 Tax=Fusarium coffeatum TaxID=231269 RepID=A0A366S4U6_9HYPO|nr:uncharacterized protein FIESC28_02847 [Fusarium coffeatum]RBR24357.1 hypothetical protein FIESC28_02847 [Fusarium coffeatum]